MLIILLFDQVSIFNWIHFYSHATVFVYSISVSVFEWVKMKYTPLELMKWCSKHFYIMIDELLWDAARLLAYVPDVKYYEQSLVLITLVSALERDHY